MLEPSPPLSRVRRFVIATMLSAGAAGALVMGTIMAAQPAHALGITVFDPLNYTQTLLSAARALTQINNQIQALQNQTTMIANQSKNLKSIDFPQLQQINQALQRIDRLMNDAKGIDFHVTTQERQFAEMFPQGLNPALTTSAQLAAARTRLDTAMAAYRQTMGVQSHVVENVAADAQALAAIVARSQGAEGALQAAQATNQLLALTAKQQFQIQSMMAAQYRAQSIEQATRAQARLDARAATTRFLGSGSAYTPR